MRDQGELKAAKSLLRDDSADYLTRLSNAEHLEDLMKNLPADLIQRMEQRCLVGISAAEEAAGPVDIPYNEFDNRDVGEDEEGKANMDHWLTALR